MPARAPWLAHFLRRTHRLSSSGVRSGLLALGMSSILEAVGSAGATLVSGIERTFDTLGVSSGFQAVMKALA